MKKTKLFCAFILAVIMYGCSSTSVVKSKGTTVPSGTVVPFGKVSNEGFAENYIDADVIVNCVFLSSQSTASYTTKKPPKDHFAFQVVGENVDLNKNELTGAIEGLVVFAPKEYSDMVFELKRGDKLQLRGGTYVTKMTLGSVYGLNSRYVHFKATNISRK